MPFQTLFASTTNTLVPTPTLSSLPSSSDARPFKFILSSSKRIAAWFGITCQDCPADTIWGCYVTKSCWKVVIVALGVVFFFIVVLMSLFFLGQINDLLKYQRQLAEWEKSYPTLAKLMIFPLKYIHKAVTKTYSNIMKSLIKKFGSKPWFKFVILWPCTCLKGIWTMFQKVLQPTCLFFCTVTAKVKRGIQDIGMPNFIIKKIGIRADPIGDAKKKKKLEKEVKEHAKQAKIDARKDKKQAKIDAREAQKKAREDAKQAKIDAKREKMDAIQEAKQDALEAKKGELVAKKEAKQEALEAREEALELKKEAIQEALEAREEALELKKEAKIRKVALEAKEVVKETKKAIAKKVANRLNVLESTSPSLSPPPPPPSPISPMAVASLEMPSTMSMAPLVMPLAPPNNTMASPIVPMAPLRVFTSPPTLLNQQPMFEDQTQQFVTGVYEDPIQQLTTNFYGTMAQQYPLDLYRIPTSQYVMDPYKEYGSLTGQTQGQVYGAYDNPMYINEQYGMHNNGPFYGQQGGFGQTQQGNFEQFHELGNLGQAQQQGSLAQAQYGAITSYIYDPNIAYAQQYYNGGYYSQ